MVNPATTVEARAAERRLTLAYAPANFRPAMAALLALDDALGDVVRTTREPMIGRIRLTWWHDALIALDGAPPPAEPVLRGLADAVLSLGVTGATLARMIGGWESLFDEAIDLERHACERGGILFAVMAQILGARDQGIEQAGQGWALADLAGHLSDMSIAERARSLAQQRLAAAFRTRFSRNARPLGALALLARADLAGTTAGSPRRTGRLLLHRLAGI